jgi:hypothetical protein
LCFPQPPTLVRKISHESLTTGFNSPLPYSDCTFDIKKEMKSSPSGDLVNTNNRGEGRLIAEDTSSLYFLEAMCVGLMGLAIHLIFPGI